MDATLTALGGYTNTTNCYNTGYFTTFPVDFGVVDYDNYEDCRWVFMDPNGGPITVSFPADRPNYGLDVSNTK